MEVEAIESEDGDLWWVVGHHSDDVALEAVNKVVASYEGEPFVPDDLTFTRSFWKDAHDAANDEMWVKCDEADDGAEPFTLVEL